jgi:hypothetical protein
MCLMMRAEDVGEQRFGEWRHEGARYCHGVTTLSLRRLAGRDFRGEDYHLGR